MIEALDELFSKISLSWCDGRSDDIINSDFFRRLLDIFPNLKKLFQDGKENDDFEFRRTIKHIFRVFKVYHLLKINKFEHKTFSPSSIQKIRDKIMHQHSSNEKYLPIILMYHDIGRFFDKKNHPHESYNIISRNKMFDLYGLSEIQKLLLIKVIQYHLFFATIYTGESTYFGVSSLINDDEFIELISHDSGKMIDEFVDLLEIFTYIDILGYPYAQLYDHYLKYYDEINLRLKKLLKFYPNREGILKRAMDYSLEKLEFRIAGALRIFQFVETKPYLTEEFFFNKIRESISDINLDNNSATNWELIKEKYLLNSVKIQIKYALPFLMMLAFGNFSRISIKKDTKISSKLVEFWIHLSKEIALRTDSEFYLWNVYFKGLPIWSKMDRKFAKKLEINAIISVIKNGTLFRDDERKEYNFHLDFTRILKK
ncbi:MAG: hypothetical protein ACTSVY_10065 [Candidatus Helarchaeota archaeon]